MTKVSIIIPVYNSEKYISKCLDSLVNQTYKDIEIIIVNDGSTDDSEKIIKEYINNYPNLIKYYKKKNGGLSSARNFGLRKVTGDYISFVDSDDYVDINLFSTLKDYMKENIDLIKYKLIKVDENYKEIEKINGPIFEELTGEEAFNLLYSNDILLEPSCLYIYRTKFFLENKFKFAEGLYHEDFGLTPLVILKSESISSIDFYGYYYLQSNNSITRNDDYKKALKSSNDLLKHYDNMIIKISKYNISANAKDNVKIYYTNAILSAINKLNKIDQKKYIEEIKKRKLIKNIKVKNIKQFFKKAILSINIKLYLKIR